MSLFEKLERKISKYAIHNLMYYIVICQVVGLVIQILSPRLLSYLTLDMYSIIRYKQIWRLVTFIIVPGMSTSIEGIGLLFTAVTLYFMYYFGKNLEGVWGAARFNLFYLSGIILNILAALIIYVVPGTEKVARFYSQLFALFGLNYINMSLIMVCCFVFSETVVLFQFIIPIKMKYLGIFYALELVVEMVQMIRGGLLPGGVAIFVALLNFAIFFFATRKRSHFSAKQVRRKIKYKEQMRNANTSGPRHRCYICGRTELDDPNLDFRYCSRCEGNYEYCSEHLFTHEHVKRH